MSHVSDASEGELPLEDVDDISLRAIASVSRTSSWLEPCFAVGSTS